MKKLLSKDAFWAFAFIAPAFLGMIVFILLPILMSFGFSFVKWDLISSPEFIGLKNYFSLVKEPEFWQVLTNTFVYAFSVAILGIILPLFLANILNKNLRGGLFYKLAYFIPFVTPMIVAAVVWEWIFDPNFGLMNTLFKTNLRWLYDKNLAMVSLIIVSVWKNLGYNTILFLAGFQGIPESIMEASDIDGATGFKKFFSVTLPMLSPTVFFVSIITIISSFQIFDLIYLMTGGGPENSTNVLVYWIYQNAFEFFKIGKASAIAYVLFGIILILTALQWNLRKRWVINE